MEHTSPLGCPEGEPVVAASRKLPGTVGSEKGPLGQGPGSAVSISASSGDFSRFVEVRLRPLQAASDPLVVTIRLGMSST